MSIEHCDNFTFYGGNTAYMTNGIYASLGTGGGSLAVDPDGLDPGKVWKQGNNNSNGYEQNLRYVFSASQNIAGWAQRIWLSAIPSDPKLFPIPFEFCDANNAIIAYVSVNPVGGFVIHNNVAATTFSTPGPVITANAWWHTECKINVSAGTFEIRVEGVTVLVITGQNFGALPVAQVSYGTANYFAVWAGQDYYKDLVLWNGSGTQNTDFLGSVIVAQLLPTADVAANWALVGAATRAAALANIPPQDGVQYIDAITPPPAAYTCTLSHLSASAVSVKAVMTLCRATKTDGGTGQLQVGLISSPGSGPATSLGANRPITTTPTYWRDVFELDPKTGAAWLPSAVNVVNMQLNRTL